MKKKSQLENIIIIVFFSTPLKKSKLRTNEGKHLINNLMIFKYKLDENTQVVKVLPNFLQVFIKLVKSSLVPPRPSNL